MNEYSYIKMLIPIKTLIADYLYEKF